MNRLDTLCRIAVIDDEPMIREMLTEVLTESGYSVTNYANAHKALHDLQTSDFDLIISDLYMPGLSGLQIFHHYTHLSGDQITPFLFMSGDPYASERIEIASINRCFFLSKPFDLNQFLTIVHRMSNQVSFREKSGLWNEGLRQAA